MTQFVGMPEGLDVSRETAGFLSAYVDLILKWTPRINLISGNSTTDIWRRHIIDSAQLFDLAPQTWRTWADLGSGAGLPGIVIAILERASASPRPVTLIESDVRKAAFLRTASRELGLNTVIFAERSEALPPLNADVVSARALGPLPELLEHCQRHLAAAGVAILPKGRRAEDEIVAARRIWRFEMNESRSRTDPDGRILRIERIIRA